MKKYFPIKIFSIKYAYGWWWGSYFFFFGKHSTAFAIMPMSFHHHQCEYMNGKAIEDGATHSWHPDRQREKNEQLIQAKIMRRKVKAAKPSEAKNARKSGLFYFNIQN